MKASTGNSFSVSVTGSCEALAICALLRCAGGRGARQVCEILDGRCLAPGPSMTLPVGACRPLEWRALCRRARLEAVQHAERDKEAGRGAEATRMVSRDPLARRPATSAPALWVLAAREGRFRMVRGRHV
eukprot:scaffold3586_cov404-Prasinococcus_capsulatus_cf.AAC.35